MEITPEIIAGFVCMGLMTIALYVFLHRRDMKRCEKILERISAAFPGARIGGVRRLEGKGMPFTFQYKGLEGEIQYKERMGKVSNELISNSDSKGSPGSVRFRLQPPGSPKGYFSGLFAQGLTIKAKVGLLSSGRVADLSLEKFGKSCSVTAKGMKIPVQDLPMELVQLVKMLSRHSFEKIVVFCGPSHFQVIVDDDIRTDLAMRDFMAGCLILLKELVSLRLPDVPGYPWGMDETYGSLDCDGGDFLPDALKDYLEGNRADAGLDDGADDLDCYLASFAKHSDFDRNMRGGSVLGLGEAPLSDERGRMRVRR